MTPNIKARLQAIIQNKQNAKHNLIDQPVFLRDLIITTPKDKSTGESKSHDNTYGADPRERLRDHIQFLFKLANTDHRANYGEITPDKQYQLQTDKHNHVTRLLMNEFSLYTEHPLKMSDFESILDDLQTYKLDSNVHVLLSSFAVRVSVPNESEKIVNMALYIEGGSPLTMHAFAKNTAYGIDVDYGRTLFSQQRRGYQVSFHAEASGTTSGTTIPMAGVFDITTLGGAKYTQVIDICSDHTSAHGRTLANRRLRDPSPTELLPRQVEHIITANSVTQRNNQSAATLVIQADPLVHMHETRDIPLGIKTLTEETKAQLKPQEKYDQLRITETESGYAISHPIFGSDCRIEVLQERPASTYVPELMANLEKCNQRYLEQQIEKSISSSHPSLGN